MEKYPPTPYGNIPPHLRVPALWMIAGIWSVLSYWGSSFPRGILSRQGVITNLNSSKNGSPLWSHEGYTPEAKAFRLQLIILNSVPVVHRPLQPHRQQSDLRRKQMGYLRHNPIHKKQPTVGSELDALNTCSV
jgi:hypothetical protein